MNSAGTLRRQLRRLRFWPTGVGLALLRVLGLLPMPVLAALGAALGMMLYAVHGERRNVVRVNIARCFPRLSRRARARLVRAHFKAFGQALVDIAVAWWASGARLRRLVRFKGREHYDRAIGGGRPVILLAPHFVGLEIGGIRLSMERPMVAMFRHPANELLRGVMQRARARFGLRLVEHKRPLTALVRQVRAGLPLYYLPDQDAGRRNGIFVPFFDIPTATYPVLGRLARLADATVIPCITRQLPRGRGYEIEFGAPLANFPSGDARADTEHMNRAIERAVRETPEQYFWVHKRFKTRPRGEAPFY